jgi:hypothetical protein
MERLMRGKKSDQVFVAEFISDAVQRGIETPIEIVQDAKRKIEQIDEEIRAIEAKKILRSKLLDVILTFEKQMKETSEDAKLLPFFKLAYPYTCKFICDIAKTHSIEIGEKFQVLGSGESDPQMRYSIKQLLECKVLQREGNQVMRGERFDEYMTFVLREAK